MTALIPGMKHGHPPAWNRPESYAFARSVVEEGAPWCRQTEVSIVGHGCHFLRALPRNNEASLPQVESRTRERVEDTGSSDTEKPVLQGDMVEVRFASSKPLERAVLVSTTDSGVTGSRKWVEEPAELKREGDVWIASAPLPSGTTAWFINVHSGGLTVSSEFQGKGNQTE
jgi:hypothetical protein